MSIASKHHYRFKYLKSDKWNNARLEALVREKGKCQICGEESIHNDAHHIWYPEDIYQTTEKHLVILCRLCHDFLHSLVPECKTRDENIGRASWLKYHNAIQTWRLQKASLFNQPNPVTWTSEAIILQKIQAIKQRLFSKKRGVVITLSNDEAGELIRDFSELVKSAIPTPSRNGLLSHDNGRQAG